MSRDRKRLFEIFWTFFLIGPSTFGGGYAMIPVIHKEVVEKKQWVKEDEMSDVLSIAGSAPGGIGVNASAFIGYRLAGTKGAAAAVLGIALPTFLIVLILTLLFSMLDSNPKVQAALEGIHAAIVGLIVVAAYNMGKSAIYDKTTLILTAATAGALLALHLNPLAAILIGLFVGLPCVWVKEKFGYKVRLEKNEHAEGEETSSREYRYSDYFIAEGI
ncbi:chromate transporter [Paenibacillus hamazuiensis]|uniref:chromate transporter n=1 Tax=Paenibacillus hamazuiensis TaxID=2936508 RepID=UPI0023DE6EE0|nr:chromate transporter [Paenibacillus hamazuiensis]